MSNDLKDKFTFLFGSTPLLISAPGRINLIGEHTDYNNGFVLPAAINKQIVFAISPNNLDVHRFIANDLDENSEIPINDISPNATPWVNYLLGVIAQMNKKGLKIPGVDCLFGGDIPLGAGLSSSAALETGFAYALNTLFNLGFSRREMVKISQMAEHEYAGVNCGIMDQFISMHGENNKVIRLDCRSLEYQLYPLELPEHDILLCNSRVGHLLASSEYNKRRKECETGVELLKKYDANVKSLRDVTKDVLFARKNEFDPVVFKRCKFVVEEIQRVLDACSALENKDLKEFGKLMYQTHTGLRDEYEVSCRELDILVDIAKESDVVGARMMGGGFGGCTINIISKEDTDLFIKTAEETYRSQTNIELKTYSVSIEKGTTVITS